MAEQVTGREAFNLGLRFINPPPEVVIERKDAADAWLDDEAHTGHYLSTVGSEDAVRTAFYFITDPEVCRLFRMTWCAGIH